jgi:hypothetical protein
VKARTAGADREAVAVARGLELDLGPSGSFAHDFVERVGGSGGGAGLGWRRLDRLGDARSMSVAARLSRPFWAVISTFDRMGIVLRRSTTLCTWARAFRSAARSIVSFMVWSL